MAKKCEITDALRELGYACGSVSLSGAGLRRAAVYFNGAYVGVYDFNKHTFVD